MKSFFLFVTLLMYLTAQAQVTIGGLYKPLPGHLLDLKQTETEGDSANSTKGLLLPRVVLSDLSKLIMTGIEVLGDDENVNATHIGLVVYNVSDTAPFCPGVYVWSGEIWIKLGDQCSIEQPEILFSENFGNPGESCTRKFPKTHFYEYADPQLSGLSESQIRDAKGIDNGYSAMVSPKCIYSSVGLNDETDWSDVNDKIYRLWSTIVQVGDATPGHDGLGGALIVNAGLILKPFYENLVLLESNWYYKLSYKVFVENPTVNIKNRIDVADLSFEENQTRDFESASGEWEEVEFWFYNALPTENTEFKISIENAHAETQGNDFAIDDVCLQKYGKKLPQNVDEKNVTYVRVE